MMYHPDALNIISYIHLAVILSSMAHAEIYPK